MFNQDYVKHIPLVKHRYHPKICSFLEQSLPSPVNSQILADGWEEAGRSMVPDALVSPRFGRSLQFFIPSLRKTPGEKH